MANIQTPAEGCIDLKCLLPEELSEYVAGLGEPPYRADQLFDWIHAKDALVFSEMTDLPATFRAELARRARISSVRQVSLRESGEDGTAKFLFEVGNARRVESVLIREGKRRTACLSSQVGCPLDCTFCATGRMGLEANLSAAQILDQLAHINRYAQRRDERVTNVVMMGMGEPLLNYDNVVRAIRLMRLRGRSGIGGRRITVSTAGYLPGIRKLAEEDLNVGLAISLNATTDETRAQIMPITRKYGIADLTAAARTYFDRRGRRVTFEYVLLDGVNDEEEDAHRLSSLTADVPCKINLIPYNELGSTDEAAPGRPVFRRPPMERIDRFVRVLKSGSSKTVTLRESRGRDIDAACGQLFYNRSQLS